MLFGTAHANASTVGGFDPMQFLPLVLIFVVFYFLLIRPQQKKMKAHQALLGALRRGDRVVTSGGIIGTVARLINDQEIEVEIADNTRVRVMRAMVSDVLTKGTPVSSTDSAEAKPAAKSTKSAVPAKKAGKTPANRSRSKE